MSFGGTELVQSVVPEWLALPFAVVTLLGDVTTFVLTLALLYWYTGRSDVAAVFGVVLAALSLTVAAKVTFGIPRPAIEPLIAPDAVPAFARSFYESELTTETAGFPSGHALGATVTWGALAAVLDVDTRRQRFACAGVAVALVCLSRLTLGVHYPVDVLAGAALGVACLVISLPLQDQFDDPVPPALGTAIVVSAGAFVATSGAPSTANAFGASAGVLLAWRALDAPHAPLPETAAGAGLGALGVVAIFPGGLALDVAVGAIVGSVLSAGVVGGAIIAVPAIRERSRAQRGCETDEEDLGE